MTRRGRRKGASRGRDLALAFLGARSADEVLLSRIIDEHIERVLDATDANVSLAAELLGMHRRSLQRYSRRKR
jgi:ActR/RegA family two-component response regulator